MTTTPPSTRTPTLATDDPALAAFAELVGENGPIAVEGRRTRWDVGGPSTTGTRLVSAPDGIVEYAPEEMTVRVRAGTTVAELHAALAERGQRTALPDRGGTVGGALAVGENDVRALGRGFIRTAPLQVRYISAEGRVVSSGGPTVKNVTGFDLPRLMTGALGTLGLLAEVILRTNPIPPVSRWLKATGAGPQAALDAVLAPSAVLWDGTSTWVELEGHLADVDGQTQALSTVGDFIEVDDGPARPSERWSLSPAALLDAASLDSGNFVAAIGLGLLFADRPQPARPLSPGLDVIGNRAKDYFDPTGRLNPGRDPGRK